MKALACLILMAPPLAAADFGSPGTSGADFMKLQQSARWASMGGAGVALAEGADGLELNPAAASLGSGASLGASHLSYLEGVRQERLALAWPNSVLDFGLEMRSLESPEIESLSASGAPAGTFKQSDLGASLSLSRALGAIRLGAQGAWMSRSLAGLSESGFSGGLGMVAGLGSQWRLGLSALNFGSLSALESSPDSSPGLFRAGLAWSGGLSGDLRMNLALDAQQPWDTSVQGRFGAELDYDSLLIARVGYAYSESFDGKQGLAIGAGMRIKGIQLDYAYAPYGNLGTTHRVGLSAWFGELGRALSGVVAPGEPLDLSVLSSLGEAKAEWKEPATGKAGSYWVYVRRGPEKGLEKIGKKPQSGRTLKLKGLKPEWEYGIAVSAVSPEGLEGPRSSEARFRPDAAKQESAAALPPHGLKVVKREGGQWLEWNAPSSAGVTGYNIYVAKRQGSGFAVLAKSVPGARYKLSGLTLPQPFSYFRVTALKASGGRLEESEFSNEVSLKTR